jgi:hypothetical protein
MEPSAALAHGGSSSATAPRRWVSSVRTEGATWLAITLRATVSHISLFFLRWWLLIMSCTVRTPSGTKPTTAAVAMMMSVTSPTTLPFWPSLGSNRVNFGGKLVASCPPWPQASVRSATVTTGCCSGTAFVPCSRSPVSSCLTWTVSDVLAHIHRAPQIT